MKLKIEHIAKRLPCGLKAEMLDYKSDYVGNQYDTIVGAHQWDKTGEKWVLLTSGGSKPALDAIKPILFPMSSLSKEITVRGKTFIPKERMSNWNMRGHQVENGTIYYDGYSVDAYSLPHFIYQELMYWHIDTDDLIELGLAISVFDLPKNPYE